VDWAAGGRVVSRVWYSTAQHSGLDSCGCSVSETLVVGAVQAACGWYSLEEVYGSGGGDGVAGGGVVGNERSVMGRSRSRGAEMGSNQRGVQVVGCGAQSHEVERRALGREGSNGTVGAMCER
jgi:hypothetical protein